MTPEDFVRELLHGAVYDPAKAHDYYLRTRVLKGRQNGSAKPSAGKNKGQVPNHPLKKPKTAVQLRKEAQAKTNALKARLEHLRDVLAKLVAEAEKRSGAKPAPIGSSANSKTSPTHHETAKEKAEKKKSAEKHKNDSPSQTDKELHTQIEQVRAQIKSIRAQIKESIDKARKKAAGHVVN